MRILLTGATGFLGGRLLRHLAGRHNVYAIVRAARANLHPGAEWLVQDLAAAKWQIRLPDGVDTVIHLAQSPHFRDFPARAPDIYGVSVNATMQLLDWAAKTGVRHFIFASTGGVYGASDAPVKEGYPLVGDGGPLGFYFAVKRCGELLGVQYAKTLRFIALRLFFVYGSEQPAQMLLPRLANNVRRGNLISLQGPDGIRLNPIHVNDAVVAIERCFALDESCTLNVAGPEVVTLRQIAQTLGEKIGRAPEYKVEAAAHPGHLVADISLMSHALGAPTMGLDAGLAEMLQGEGPA